LHSHDVAHAIKTCRAEKGTTSLPPAKCRDHFNSSSRLAGTARKHVSDASSVSCLPQPHADGKKNQTGWPPAPCPVYFRRLQAPHAPKPLKIRTFCQAMCGILLCENDLVVRGLNVRLDGAAWFSCFPYLAPTRCVSIWLAFSYTVPSVTCDMTACILGLPRKYGSTCLFTERRQQSARKAQRNWAD